LLSLSHLDIGLAIQYAVHAFGLRVVAIGMSSCSLVLLLPISHCSVADTGAEKKELCLSLGAEKWIDFRETKDLVKDIKNATGGEGPHAALVSAASVSFFV
jgi:propanol-preferring alcohol dehydrogenase